MQIVTDSSADLTPEQKAGLEIHYVPLTFTLDGKTYRCGEDIQPEEFYRLLESTKSFPNTSQPSAGEFAEVYHKLAANDPEILSFHISSGLSGTINSARIGAGTVPEAKVTLVDTKTLSGAQGWQIEAAAKAIKVGWPKEKILTLVKQISDATDTLYTLPSLKYLIHGGRINHLKGLLASLLNILPIIGVEKIGGTYVQHGKVRTMTAALNKIVELVLEKHPPGSLLRLQILHGNNLDGVKFLKQKLEEVFKCKWLPSSLIAPALGAHTGPGLVGVVFAPESVFPALA
ncbi:MAG: DegV family protein [Firmicutes bacterium]|nr:DegV family protein [Bacillota bacterium]